MSFGNGIWAVLYMLIHRLSKILMCLTLTPSKVLRDLSFFQPAAGTQTHGPSYLQERLGNETELSVLKEGYTDVVKTSRLCRVCQLGPNTFENLKAFRSVENKAGIVELLFCVTVV